MSQIQSSWTPAKLDQAWRVFDRALVVMADGISVPADELRAFLLEGTKPKMQTLTDRIVECHKANPLWTAKDVAEELFASYDTVRGLAARAGVVWPNNKSPAVPKLKPTAAPPEGFQKADDAFLAQHGKNARFRLRDQHGDYLHMQVNNQLLTRELTYAWRGTRDQLRAVRSKYEFARKFEIVAVSA